MGDSIISYSSDKKGIVTSKSTVDDLSPDITSLRPDKFKDYIGQKDTVESWNIFCFTVLPGWGKQQYPISLPMKWKKI